MKTEEIAGTPRSLSRSQYLTRMNIAAGFAAVFAAVTGTALTRYGQTLGMTPFGFGLLAALPFLTALVQVPASYLVERYGGRRRTAILGILIHRALWLAIAAVPWVVPRAWWWPGLLAGVALSSTFAHIATPAATSWAADLVPARLRGRYYSLRGQLVRLITVPLCLFVGWAMDRGQLGGTQLLLQVLSLLLAGAAAVGMVDSLLYLALPDRWHRPQAESLRIGEIIRQPLGNRNFRYYLGYVGFITFATGFIGPFVWLYLIDVVKTSNLEATMMTMVGTAVVGVIGMRFWGARVDHWGYRRVLLIGGICIINGATTWALVTPTTKAWGYVFVLISSFAWPAMELAAGNLLYAMSESGRTGANPGSAYAALNSTVIAVSGTLSGVFGGWVAEMLKDWHAVVWGWPVTFHVVLFFISAFFRIVALLFILGLRDERKGYK